jgi:hypothetical protein
MRRVLFMLVVLLVPASASAQGFGAVVGFGPFPILSAGIEIPIGPIAIRPMAQVPFPTTWGAGLSLRGTSRIYPVVTRQINRYSGLGTSRTDVWYAGGGARITLPRDRREAPDSARVDMHVEYGYAWRSMAWRFPRETITCCQQRDGWQLAFTARIYPQRQP